jgi:methyltransferase-like protein
MEVIIIGLILHPNIRLRSEGDRAVLFSITEGENVGETIFKFLHPQHAAILALFDGHRDISDVTKAVAYMVNVDLQTASKKVETLLNMPLNSKKSIRSLIVD